MTKSIDSEADFLYRYYLNQAQNGYGTIYSGPIYMTGHGIGSHLARIFRTVLPFIRSGAKSVGKEMLKTGSRIIRDVAEDNIPISDSIKTRSKETINRVLSGKGYKRKMNIETDHLPAKRIKSSNKNRKKKNKKLRKNRERDLFD
jgi:hypothetical protein